MTVIARYSATGARTYLTDALNTVLAQTREDQTIQNFYAYSPYGEASALGDDEGNAIRYTARENDNTGLYFYRARYYDPVLKRFVSEDPIGVRAGINRYAYVDGDPVSLVDPLGLWSFTFGGFAGVGGPGALLTFGQNPNGSGFMSLQFGFGFGGGFSVNPLGQQPGYSSCQGNRWGLGLGVYGQGNFNAGPFSGGLGANLGRNFTWDGSDPYGAFLRPSVSGRTGQWGINLTGSVGGQITIFGGGTVR